MKEGKIQLVRRLLSLDSGDGSPIVLGRKNDTFDNGMLELSGIGNPEILTKINRKIDLPGVIENVMNISSAHVLVFSPHILVENELIVVEAFRFER